VGLDRAQPGPARDSALVKKGRPSKVVPPEVAAAIRLLQAAQETDPELGLFLRLASALGSRRGELGSLRWSDIDFDHGEVLVDPQRLGTRPVQGGGRQGRTLGRVEPTTGTVPGKLATGQTDQHRGGRAVLQPPAGLLINPAGACFRRGQQHKVTGSG
jgi:hypothetical protein